MDNWSSSSSPVAVNEGDDLEKGIYYCINTSVFESVYKKRCEVK